MIDKCTDRAECGGTNIKVRAGKAPTKRVGPDQDGLFYRVECTVSCCPHYSYPAQSAEQAADIIAATGA